MQPRRPSIEGYSYREFIPQKGSQEATFHNFGGQTVGLDEFILHDEVFQTTGATIVRTSFGGRYPSDHFPVTALLFLRTVPERTTCSLLVIVAVATLHAWQEILDAFELDTRSPITN